MAGSTGGMSNHHDGLTAGIQTVEQAQQLIRGLGVQRAGGFVRQNQLGLGDHRPGHGGALLLTAGDLIGIFFQQPGDAQACRQVFEPPVHLGVFHAREHKGQIDVVLQGEGVQQVKILEYKAQIVPAEPAELLVLETA